MTLCQALGAIIRSRKALYNLTLAELAANMKCSTATISYMETGTKWCGMEYYIQIVPLLHMNSLSHLIFDAESFMKAEETRAIS